MATRAKESSTGASQRWQAVTLLQGHYSTFAPFLLDVMAQMGFKTSPTQIAIAHWLEHGPSNLMVQAQRGQAKTTIAAAYAVWCLIHSPAHRILVISAGGKQAMEISTLIVRIIEGMDELACLRPDKMAGDRTGMSAYDLHHSLKGIEKSASVVCSGITANLQGGRADLILADDVESGKNSQTGEMRAKLAHITKDFPSICSKGRIIWLGTPQTVDSIYNALPAHGTHIRIWPGRYPNEAQQKVYGGFLAPEITRAMQNDPSLITGGGLLGDQGKAVDPVLLPEDVLQSKELAQGPEYFQLQHMLNTTLTDAIKYPLKLDKIVFMRGGLGVFPVKVVRGFSEANLVPCASGEFGFNMSRAHDISQETSVLLKRAMYIDPAAGGAGADETAYACGGFLSGNIFLTSVGGIPGGYGIEAMEALADKALEQKVDVVIIEKNMGYGAFRTVFQPILKRKHPSCQLLDDQVHGQKERRIIETIGPVIGRGALIVTDEALAEDGQTLHRYSNASRQTYSLFYQLAKISANRGALVHDDRADALEGLVRFFQPSISADQDALLSSQRKKAHLEYIRDPLGHGRFSSGPSRPSNNLLTERLAVSRTNVFNKR